MGKRLTEVGVANIYQNKFTLKIATVAVALLIGTVSIIYTNSLVNELKEREQKLIELFANTLEYTGNENNSDNLVFIFQEIIVANNSVPVILADAEGNPVNYNNITIKEPITEEEKEQRLKREMAEMRLQHEPIEIALKDPETGRIYEYNYVYYKNSKLLSQLTYYPYIQLSVISVFAILAYLAFSYSKTAEQNRVWVGLAKETAHQLGTPLSSLMAWVEYFRTDPVMDQSIVDEINKDIRRLDMVTSRFSNIGSVPTLRPENIYEVIKEIITYLEPRISTKVKISVEAHDEEVMALINKPLFDWVIENLCKNAVDAMRGIGTIKINIGNENPEKVIIDITDDGKGIAKSKIKKVFQPGFTTKKRGWGLGLTLAKRIIDQYHQGKIYVKSSTPDVGTTFSIILKTVD